MHNSDTLLGKALEILAIAQTMAASPAPAANPVSNTRKSEAGGIALRLIGGLAVRARCPSSLRYPFARESSDADFIAQAKAGEIEEVFKSAGWKGDHEFNLYNGKERLIFRSPEGVKADVFVGRFDMCHAVPLEGRLAVDSISIPLAELLLTKLQVVEANVKDLSDVACILADHEVGSLDGDTINENRFATLCAADWGLWRTATGNLERLRFWSATSIEDAGLRDRILERADMLAKKAGAWPKTSAWKLRAAIGDRLRWYKTPEEVEA